MDGKGRGEAAGDSATYPCGKPDKGVGSCHWLAALCSCRRYFTKKERG